MKQVVAFVKPHMLPRVAMALRELPGLTGLSMTKGQGFGRGRARSATHRVIEDQMAYIPHVRLEVFCGEEHLEAVVGCIVAQARTGLSGDGKVFVAEVLDAIRISSGDRGPGAV